jgi:hypothetical protein
MMGRAAAVLLAAGSAGCSFTVPGSPVQDARSIEDAIFLGGDGAPPDAGSAADGGAPLEAGSGDLGPNDAEDGGPLVPAIQIEILPSRTATPGQLLPLDTLLLKSDGTQIPAGASATFTWSAGTPSSADHGFAPWPGTPGATSTGTSAIYYTSAPGTYVFDLTVTAGGQVATKEVSIFVPRPQRIPGTTEDVRSIAVRGDGDLFFGTSTGTGGAFQFMPGTGAANPIGCVPAGPIALVGAGSSSMVFAFDDSAKITLYDGAACATHDPVAELSISVMPPTQSNAIAFTGPDDFWVATDRDLLIFSAASERFASRFGPLAGFQHYLAVAVPPDGSNAVWLSSNGGMSSGDALIGTTAMGAFTNLPILPMNDDITGMLPGLYDPARGLDELYLLGGAGIVRVSDVNAPSVFAWYGSKSASLRLPLPDKSNGGALDAATGDVWFAMEGGVLRYKRDVGEFAGFANGQWDLDSGSATHQIAFDQGPRGRIIYIATAKGVFMNSAP